MSREIDDHTSEADFTLAELVGDPLVALVMKSDGVERRGVELLFERIARVRPRTAHPRGGASRR